MNISRIKNTFRNILLVVQVLLLGLLTLMMWHTSLQQLGATSDALYDRLYAALPLGDGGYVQHIGEAAAASPTTIAMTAADGTLSGAAYNETITGALYEAVRPILARALSGAQGYRETQEQELVNALQGQTLLMRYDAALPLSIVEGWLGAKVQSSELVIDTVVLTQSGHLFVRDGTQGTLYIANAPVEDAEWQAAQSTLPSTVCSYAVDAQGGLLPETMVPKETMAYDVLSVVPPAFGDPDSGDSMQMLLEAFRYSAYVKNYAEDDGNAQIFVENYGTLRVERNGSVQYRANATTDGLAAYPDGDLEGTAALAARIEYAQQILNTVSRALQGNDTTTALFQVREDVQGNTAVLKFIQTIHGVPIQGKDAFARMEFRGGTLVSADILLKSYQATGEKLYVLPARQVAVTVPEGATVQWRVAYQDNGDGRLLAASYLE